MSQDTYDNPPSRRDGNNVVPRPSQNKSKLLEATMRNVPKLKELNYTQWKNMITNSIKNAKLWGYIDGSIGQPSEDNGGDLAIYFDEAGAVRNAMLGSLESGAQKYIEDAFDPKDAWLALEKKYLTAESEADSRLISIEQKLANLRLEEGGDMIEHIAEFCRMRSQLSETRFAVDDQACVSMLYRSLPPSFRQSAITPEGTEMKDLSALCTRLTYLSQNPEPEVPIEDKPPAVTEDYTNWGVPEDIRAFGLTGDKNPLLKDRAVATCRDCLLKGHKAGSPECPQYEWRKELWGIVSGHVDEPDAQTTDGSTVVKSKKKLTYEFSEPLKVVLNFNEMKLKPELVKQLGALNITRPSAIQQCAIIPMTNGRNVMAQATKDDGKTTALALSVLQAVDLNIPASQVLVLTQNKQVATKFHKILSNLAPAGSLLWAKPYLCDENAPVGTDLSQLGIERGNFIIMGTPMRVLELIRRRILSTGHLKLLAIDNIDLLIESEFDDQMLEIRRRLPCSLQTVATLTTSSARLIRVTNNLMTNPLYITAEDNSIFFHARHFFVVVPTATERSEYLYSLRSSLQTDKIIVFMRDSEARQNGTIVSYLGYSLQGYPACYMVGNMSADQCNQEMQQFLSRPAQATSGYYHTLVTTDSAPLTQTKVVNQPNIPLIHYHAPSNRKEYAKRLAYYGGSGKYTMTVTFIIAETDEMRVIHEIEQYYGIQMVELHRDGNTFG
ncbi:ATP-dependent RNA helicase FAL1 [Ustilago maydis 521] [Rhizoctonia solani]|uniref:ATP-dependent RNA helicase n=1 Tax=Rhizoctonia solani TaxID=456999 RepID=A0A0K6FNX8_9AGAM|nr:ATP-dependent RNA helicase FAL1 [Ustilago maydis 521] [Rhizoctonia solani]